MNRLTAPTDSSSDQLAAVREEQVRRWRAGERPPVEEFLKRNAEIAADPEAVIILLYGEALLRQELEGTILDPAEYAARFPNCAEALAAQFEFHGALAAQNEFPDFPGFELLRELGRGGMGVVYLARDQSLNRLVAVKVLISGQFASATARQRFRMEAEAAAGLRHPHIVEIHSFGDHNGRPYIVMEHVAGRSLNEHLDGTPLAPRTAARLVCSLADAVQHAHQAGIVHRDLKPANILLRAENSERLTETETPRALDSDPNLALFALISDFGLAKRLDSEGPTATSQVLGTPSYMAPEQAAGAKNSSPAVDIYALGAILYECLTGRPPFKAATPLETLAQITDREPATPRTVNAAIPRDLETICLKCLAKDPGERYASAGALAEDLERLLAGRLVLARPVGALGRSWRWVKRRPALAGMAAALAILIPTALIVTTVLYLRAEQRGRESLALRCEAVERMSGLAVARSRQMDPAEAATLHRACAEEYARLAEAGIDPPRSRFMRAEHISWEAYDLSRQGKYEQAESVADDAIGAFKDCQAEQPNSSSARRGLFEARFRRAVAIRRLQRVEEAMSLLDELVIEAPDVFGNDRSPRSELCLSLRDLHQNRASALYALSRYAECEAACDEALHYDDGSQWADIIIVRAGMCARNGRSAEAIETLQAQLRNPHLSAWNVYNMGCVFALASTASDLPEAARAAAAESSIAAFRRVLAIDPQMRTAIEADPELKSLHGRPDFQALLVEK
jgi:tetratricopeptide (TPR) repeat protein